MHYTSNQYRLHVFLHCSFLSKFGAQLAMKIRDTNSDHPRTKTLSKNQIDDVRLLQQG